MADIPFEFTVTTYNNVVSLTVVIPQNFDKGTLIIKDKAGKIWRNSDVWFKDKDGANRQVIDVDKTGEYNFEVTCEKEGFQSTTKTGNF